MLLLSLRDACIFVFRVTFEQSTLRCRRRAMPCYGFLNRVLRRGLIHVRHAALRRCTPPLPIQQHSHTAAPVAYEKLCGVLNTRFSKPVAVASVCCIWCTLLFPPILNCLCTGSIENLHGSPPTTFLCSMSPRESREHAKINGGKVLHWRRATIL